MSEKIRIYPAEGFPDSTLATEGMKHLKADNAPKLCKVLLGVEYAQKDGQNLCLQIILPPSGVRDTRKYPLVLYVQGSAWMEQQLGMSMHCLCEFAKRGYVVAIVQYRHSGIAPFPAQIKDVKTAARFMLKNAKQYNVDTDRVVVWGDSSGGHTSTMVNVTLDLQDFSDEPLDTEPLEIKAFINYYGPTEISRMNEYPSVMDHNSPDSPEGKLIGGFETMSNPDKVWPTVPMNYLSAENRLRPLLMIHGSSDKLVPFHQSILLYEAIKRKGLDRDVEFYKLSGADHGGDAFWTTEVLDVVERFIRRYI